LFEEIDVLRENMSGFNSKASEVSLELARFYSCCSQKKLTTTGGTYA